MAIFWFLVFFTISRTASADPSVAQLEPVVVNAERLTAPPFNTDPQSRADFYTEDFQERGMNRLPYINNKLEIRKWKQHASQLVSASTEIIVKAKNYQTIGLHPKDALHCACAV